MTRMINQKRDDNNRASCTFELVRSLPFCTTVLHVKTDKVHCVTILCLANSCWLTPISFLQREDLRTKTEAHTHTHWDKQGEREGEREKKKQFWTSASIHTATFTPLEKGSFLLQTKCYYCTCDDTSLQCCFPKKHQWWGEKSW